MLAEIVQRDGPDVLMEWKCHNDLEIEVGSLSTSMTRTLLKNHGPSFLNRMGSMKDGHTSWVTVCLVTELQKLCQTFSTKSKRNLEREVLAVLTVISFPSLLVQFIEEQQMPSVTAVGTPSGEVGIQMQPSTREVTEIISAPAAPQQLSISVRIQLHEDRSPVGRIFLSINIPGDDTTFN